MTAESVTCPPEGVLSDFGLGKLDATDTETVSRHLETCADCRQRVASLPGDSFVGRLREAGGTGQPGARRERVYVPGESLANAANSTDGSSLKESRHAGIPRPSPTVADHAKRDGLGSPSSPISAPPELANHPDYELIKELGHGGMGTVYLAQNRIMDRMEVLKVVSPALLDQPGALERFQQEIRSAAKLSHPNIVAAHSVLRPGDLLVFAMEYVRGQDLAAVVKGRGYLPVANAAFYIQQVALGLQHAFEKGMVHRDIKPNNLMLAIEGKKHTVKILDFGLAKASSEKGAETGLTKSGQMLGTPDYVAPEQSLDAHQADIRADIYSLGCTLYFLLSGRPPFQETSLYEILEAHHKRDAKPLNLLRPDVPVELAAVVAKMMAKDPTKRFQTPAEVAKALVPFFKPGQSAAAAAPTDAAGSVPAADGAATAVPPITPPPPPFPTPVVRIAPVPTPLAPLPVAMAVPLPAAEPAAHFSVSVDTRRAAVRRPGGWSSLPPPLRWALAIGLAAALVFGIVLLRRIPKGILPIEPYGPQASVAVAVDDHPDLDRADEPPSLVAGDLDPTVKEATSAEAKPAGEHTDAQAARSVDTPAPAIAPFDAQQAPPASQASQARRDAADAGGAPTAAPVGPPVVAPRVNSPPAVARPLPPPSRAPQRDLRLFELIAYHALPGRLNELHTRFRNHTTKLFEKHRITNVGYWVPLDNRGHELIALLAFPSGTARDSSWKAFHADSEWLSVKRKSERQGKLYLKAESRLLVATDYSPEIKPSNQGHRVFELRVYTATGGNLGALNARFRDHTLALFAEHGIASIAYWNEQAGTPAAGRTLVYLLAHADQTVAHKSFAAFESDPQWVAVRRASEEAAGGPLTTKDGVKSTLMQPTDYSPMR